MCSSWSHRELNGIFKYSEVFAKFCKKPPLAPGRWWLTIELFCQYIVKILQHTEKIQHSIVRPAPLAPAIVIFYKIIYTLHTHNQSIQ